MPGRYVKPDASTSQIFYRVSNVSLLSRQIYAVPDLCCIVSLRLVMVMLRA